MSNPLKEILNRIQRNKTPKTNYHDAVDMDISKLRSSISTNILEPLGLPTGLSNCTLTASQWVNPNMPIGKASTIVTNPEKYGFSESTEKDTMPGSLVIASKDPTKFKDGVDNIYHTMVLSGYAPKDINNYVYSGKTYNIKKGEPLVSYSRGKGDLKDNYRYNIPLRVYNDQSEGKFFNRFYLPLLGVPQNLSEVVISSNKKGEPK